MKFNRTGGTDLTGEKIKFFSFFILGILGVITGLIVVPTVIFTNTSFPLFMGEEARIKETLRRTDIPPEIVQRHKTCIREIHLHCAVVPVTSGSVLHVVVKEKKTLHGKWGGYEPELISRIPLMDSYPEKVKDWQKQISSGDRKELASITAVINLGNIPTDMLHSYEEVEIQMRYVFPSPSWGNTFDEIEGTANRNLTFYVLTEEEQTMLGDIRLGSTRRLMLALGILSLTFLPAYARYECKKSIRKIRPHYGTRHQKNKLHWFW